VRRAVVEIGQHVGPAAGQDDAVQPRQQGGDVGMPAVGSMA
jgi:hypothetical protein